MTKTVFLDDPATWKSATGSLSRWRGGVLSIGNFDGVHRGHKDLLRRLKAMSDRVGGPAIAMVFDPHPAALLRPDALPPRLTGIPRRGELMSPLGIDALLVCPTTTQFLSLTAAEFFEQIIVSGLAARGMVEGPNFFFGRDRGGDVTKLAEYCRRRAMRLEIADPLHQGGRMISSSRVRDLLCEGDVAAAADLLGHPHQIRGDVVGGARRGRTIGFPTANLAGVDVMIPAAGVYAGTAILPAGDRYAAAIHLGGNPTFENRPQTKLEVHLLDYSGDLYGQVLRVDFVDRVRDVRRFASGDDLAKQLSLDVQTVRTRLSSAT